jgi:hypothetical protein
MSKESELYLVGNPTSSLSSSNTYLPSGREVFRVFCHLHLNLRLQMREASESTVEQVMTIWNKFCVPTCRKDNAITKLEKLYKEWTTVKKNKNRKSELQTSKEDEFCLKMNNLFDIANAEALTLMQDQMHREFLIAQRKPRVREFMRSVNKSLPAEELVRIQSMGLANHPKKSQNKFENDQSVQCEPSSSVNLTNYSSSSESEVSDDEEWTNEPGTRSVLPQPRVLKNVITPRLAAALDRAKLSDRMAVFVLTETARSLGHDITTLNINRSSIKRHREEHRATIAAIIKTKFVGDEPLVVHWDGKLMADISGKEHVDRLPIIVSGNGLSQLLQVSKLTGGTGKNQACAVVEALEDWNVKHRVVGMCFDTTVSNTGCHIGACTLIEGKLGKDLLHFACRHHVMELLAGAAFGVSVTTTSGPYVVLFKRFQSKWSTIDHSKYSTVVDDEELSAIIDPLKEEILKFASHQLLQTNIVRGDYREFVELSMIFLGVSPPRGTHFRAPGAMHHARWMSKVIYSMKIWLFRSEFKLTKSEERGIRQMCLFAVIVYLKAWFSAPLPASAPRHDLCLLQNLYKYRQYNECISEATCKKFESHLWYLSEQLVGLAFFDPDVSVTTKRKMVEALHVSEEEHVNSDVVQPKCATRISITAENSLHHSLEDFVTCNTRKLFEKLNISTDFLDEDPEIWADLEDFKKGTEIVNHLLVTNDNAERGVSLVQELNQLNTHDEEQFQFLLQVVADHRKKYPSCKKSQLVEAD